MIFIHDLFEETMAKLKSLSPEDVELDSFLTDYCGDEAGCGTVGCVAGWMATTAAARKLGIQIVASHYFGHSQSTVDTAVWEPRGKVRGPLSHQTYFRIQDGASALIDVVNPRRDNEVLVNVFDCRDPGEDTEITDHQLAILRVRGVLAWLRMYPDDDIDLEKTILDRHREYIEDRGDHLEEYLEDPLHAG